MRTLERLWKSPLPSSPVAGTLCWLAVVTVAVALLPLYMVAGTFRDLASGRTHIC